MEPLDQALLSLAPEGVDAILDVVGDRSTTSRVARAVKDGGALFSTAFGLDEKLLDDERIRTANYRLDRKPERLIELTKHVTAGTLRPVVGAELSLEEAPSALINGVEISGLRGKTLLRVR
ncbi:zinc-binding dehydrogenase [Saccharopolyspora pogona]|uniref:zinc-binding dehydrogenase n=1 Tax=Saccharopolyspora pogona TaxID=333966 RepID=UPI00168233BE|nr:zinc-binding dehydrogenase [Saccharopolyspora pogona]